MIYLRPNLNKVLIKFPPFIPGLKARGIPGGVCYMRDGVPSNTSRRIRRLRADTHAERRDWSGC